MAAFAPDRPLPEGARAMPHVRRWLDRWRPLEPGVCYEEQQRIVGAAWTRRVEPVLARSVAREPLPEAVVAVEPDRRGRGIGARLLEALVARAREAGAPGVCVPVSERNLNAARLYERVGFVATGRTATGLETMELHFDTDREGFRF